MRRQCATLINARDDSRRDTLHILIPISAILYFAIMVVSPLTMDEEDGKVDDVKVGKGRVESGGKAVRETHDQVSEIVGMPRCAPPSTRDELGTPLGGHVAQILGVSSLSELILFTICRAENVIAQGVQYKDGSRVRWPEFDRVPG